MSTALGASPRQPNIAYQPDLESYQNRTKERLATESLSKELPDGFPAELRSPLVWKGSDFGERQDFVTVLAADDLEEIKEALRHFKGKSVSIDVSPRVDCAGVAADRAQRCISPWARSVKILFL